METNFSAASVKTPNGHAMEVNGLRNSEATVKPSGNFCDRHSDEQLKKYCVECKLVLCAICFDEGHSTHDFSDIHEVAEDTRKKMKLTMADVAEKAAHYAETLASLSRMDKECGDHEAELEKEIRERAENLKASIEAYKDRLVEELGKRRKTRSKRVEMAGKQLEGQLATMESFRKHTEELVEKGAACDIVKAANDFDERAKQLFELNANKQVDSESFKSNTKFSHRDVSLADIQELFGELTEDLFKDGCDSLIAVSSNQSISLQPIHIVPTNGNPVGGVTSLGNEVYVVRNGAQQVDVYDADTMAEKRKISISGLGEVWCGLAACTFNKCLYIADYSNSVVHRVDLADNDAVTFWSVMSSNPEGLSVNRNRPYHVLIAGFSTYVLYEYTTRGTLVRQIALQSGIELPTHAIHVSDHLFGVTHRGRRTHHGYSIVGADGRVVKSYGVTCGSGPQQLNRPYGIAIDKRGFTFLADRKNNRIVVLDSDILRSRLVTIDDVDGSGGLEQPICLWLDESRRRIYIGDDKGRVIVVRVARERDAFGLTLEDGVCI